MKESSAKAAYPSKLLQFPQGYRSPGVIIHCISARLKARCTPFKADNGGYFTVQAWWPGRFSAAKPKARIRNIATRPLPAWGD